MVSGTDLSTVKSTLKADENKYVSLSFTDCESMTEIVTSAFRDCTNLASVVIPDGVTSIGASTFYGCTSLKSVVIPNSVRSIGSNAFRDCTNLTSVVIPYGVTSIGIFAFRDCTSLESVVIPNSVTAIDGTAFQNCEVISFEVDESNPAYKSVGGSLLSKDGTSLIRAGNAIGEFSFPSSVTRIDEDAFYGCTSLATINYTGTEEQWNAIHKGSKWNNNCPANMNINCNYTAE